MSDLPSVPYVEVSLNDAGELVLRACQAPSDAVIRVDINPTKMRLLPTQGEYLAPIQAPAGTQIAYRLFEGKRALTETELFTMPRSSAGVSPNSPFIPCTQNRDFRIYDWIARHRAICRLVQERKPELLFIGDSITHFWGGDPVDPSSSPILQRSPETWEQCTNGLRTLNLGFGYDRIENVLWRIRHGELDGAADNAICVLLIGTNNLSENTNEEIVAGIREIICDIQTRLPRVRMILQACYPRNSSNPETAPRIRAINALMRSWADERDITFTEPGQLMLDESGRVPEVWSEDGLHPSPAGYARLATVLAPLIDSVAKKRN